MGRRPRVRVDIGFDSWDKGQRCRVNLLDDVLGLHGIQIRFETIHSFQKLSELTNLFGTETPPTRACEPP